jgi:hypothetical protein
MALAEGMRNLVNSIKQSRAARHAFVKGNRENTHAMQQENRNFLKQTHDNNRQRAKETREFLKMARETSRQSFKATMDDVHRDLDRVHASVKAIRQESQDMSKRSRDDHDQAVKFWASLGTTDDLIPEEEIVDVVEKAGQRSANASAAPPVVKSKAHPLPTAPDALQKPAAQLTNTDDDAASPVKDEDIDKE